MQSRAGALRWASGAGRAPAAEFSTDRATKGFAKSLIDRPLQAAADFVAAESRLVHDNLTDYGGFGNSAFRCD